jgi:putative intracellular protease/amidase
MKTIVMLLAENNFRDAEYIVPAAFFEQYGADVKTVSTKFKSVGKFGLEVHHDLALDEVDYDQCDGVFMVGGMGSLDFIDNETAKNLIYSFYSAGKPVGAICAAPQNLLAWGLLTGKKCTGYNPNDEFKILCDTHGAGYVHRPVVVDGNICTGTGPHTAGQTAIEFWRLIS